MKNFTNFSFHAFTDMLFGKNTEEETVKMIRKHGGSRVMLVYGGGSVKKSGLYDRVVKSLKTEGLYFVEFGGVKANPQRSVTDKAVKIAQDEKIDFMLGMGGGSSIDTAKAIAFALANNGEFWKFFTGEATTDKAIPIGSICTLSASGAETSRAAVLVDDVDTGLKYVLFSNSCRSTFTILNPELTYTVSAYHTGAGAADIVAHTIGRYFTKGLPASNLGDEFAEGLMRTAIKYGPIAIANPNDYEARAELMMAATFSHNDLTGVGKTGARGGDHPLELQFSAHYDTVHGAGLAAVMPAWLQYIVDNGKEEHIARVAQFGVKVFGVSPDFSDIKQTANSGLAAFRSWVRSIGMPLTIKEMGIPIEDLPLLVKRTVDANKGLIPGFIDMDEKAIKAIYTSMLG